MENKLNLILTPSPFPTTPKKKEGRQKKKVSIEDIKEGKKEKVKRQGS